MTACGVWLARRGLVAVVVDDDGRRASPAVTTALTDEARWGLLEHLDAVHGLDCELVLPADLVQGDAIGRLAVQRRTPVLVAPQRLLDAIRAVAGFTTGPPARTAAMIARLAIVPSLRSHLRPLSLPGDQRQLPLL